MITRKIGKLLRGSATPAQIMMAAVLGSVIGFMPGFTQAGGLIVLALLCLVILNANLALAGLVGLVAKALSLALLPVSFAVGRVLLDGPLSGLFAAMVNAPVLALFGFEYYVTTGGLVLGLAFGVAAGFAVTRGIRSFRRKMAKMESGSERYQKITGKKWVKLLAWVVIGGGHKGSYEDVLARKGKVIRPIGVVFAIGVVALLVVAQMFFAGPIVTAALQRGLERANGATVDVDSAELNLGEGRLTVTGLAMADPNALATDLLRADGVEADISGVDLLRKRVTLDRVVVSGAVSGEARRVPGRLVGDRPRASQDAQTQEGEKTIEDYIAEAEKWKERLAQVREWLDRVGGSGGDEGADETRDQRVRRQIEESGYARVRAEHLIEGAPTVTVTELIAEAVRMPAGLGRLSDETVDIHANNLSTHPHLLAGAPKIVIESSGDALDLDLSLGSVSSGGGDSTVRFALRGLDGDAIGSQLAVGGAAPISGGTVDVEMDGGLTTTPVPTIDLPLNVTLHGTTVTIPGAGSSAVERLSLPLGLRGPVDAPAIMLNDKLLADALMQAGADALAGRLRQEAGAALEEATGRLGEQLGEEATRQIGDNARGVLQGILGGDRDDK